MRQAHPNLIWMGGRYGIWETSRVLPRGSGCHLHINPLPNPEDVLWAYIPIALNPNLSRLTHRPRQVPSVPKWIARHKSWINPCLVPVKANLWTCYFPLKACSFHEQHNTSVQTAESLWKISEHRIARPRKQLQEPSLPAATKCHCDHDCVF